MASRDLSSCFSMAAFLAFIELRSYRALHPALDITEAIASVEKVKTGASGLDFRGAIALIEALDDGQEWEASKTGLRLFVYEWVRLAEPVWLRFVPYGRERLRSALNYDEVQCFREAGLFDDIPDDDAIKWWDRIAALMRSAVDIEKMERARFAERLSLDYERRRLKNLGIQREPRWVSLEDNTLGYDILSYDHAAGHIANRLIEVKGTMSGAIFLTRNEWQNAFSSPERTVFHIWRLPEEKLCELHVAEMHPNIPRDHGAGRWENVQIMLNC